MAFIKIGKGAKVKGLKAHDNIMRGEGDFINNEGKLEEAELKRNIQIIPKRIRKIGVAIKKPSANDNEGWKIMIVGCILAFVLAIVGMAIYDFYVKPSLSTHIGNNNKSN
jgi:hypothetical protein